MRHGRGDGRGDGRGAGAPPSASSSQRARRRRVAAERAARSARILVCECDAGSRPSIGDAVRDLGYEVVAHHSLADALRDVAASPPDLVIASFDQLDHERSSLLGLLRRSAPTVRLVIVTGDGSMSMRLRCQTTRPYYVAVRPLPEGELRSILAGALARA